MKNHPSEPDQALVLRAVGEFIRSVRVAQNLSQQEASAATQGHPWKLSRSAISSIERGRGLPSLEAVIALSRTLHIDPLEILDRAERSLISTNDLEGAPHEELLAKADELFWSGDHRKAAAAYELLLSRLPVDDFGIGIRDPRFRHTEVVGLPEAAFL